MKAQLFIVLLSLLFAFALGDACDATCPTGTKDVFKMPSYAGYGLEYVHDPSQLPLANATVHDASIKRGVIIIHGNDRNVNDYWCWMTWALDSVGMLESSYVLAPHFMIETDGPANDTFFWTNGVWMQAGASSAKKPPRIASFTMLDDILLYFANKTYFPGLEEIFVTGHSGGGQAVQRYAVSTAIDSAIAALNVTLRYVSENPGSYTYLDTRRVVLPPVETPTCSACGDVSTIPTTNYTFAEIPGNFSVNVIDNDYVNCSYFNDWKMGFNAPLTYLSKRSATDMVNQYPGKDVTYVFGTNDTCNAGLGDCGCDDHTLDKDCDAYLQGYCRYQRGWIYYRYLQFFYGRPTHNIAIVDGVGHDGCRMIWSNTTLSVLFPSLFPSTTTGSDATTGTTTTTTTGGDGTTGTEPTNTTTTGEPAATTTGETSFALATVPLVGMVFACLAIFLL